MSFGSEFDSCHCFPEVADRSLSTVFFKDKRGRSGGAAVCAFGVRFGRFKYQRLQMATMAVNEQVTMLQMSA
jgi:hypothetical protein